MLSSKFEIGDVVEFHPSWEQGRIGVAIIVAPCASTVGKNCFYLRWISAPTHHKYYWNHLNGDYISTAEWLTKITHAEGVDAIED